MPCWTAPVSYRSRPPYARELRFARYVQRSHRNGSDAPVVRPRARNLSASRVPPPHDSRHGRAARPVPGPRASAAGPGPRRASPSSERGRRPRARHCGGPPQRSAVCGLRSAGSGAAGADVRRRPRREPGARGGPGACPGPGRGAIPAAGRAGAGVPRPSRYARGHPAHPRKGARPRARRKRRKERGRRSRSADGAPLPGASAPARGPRACNGSGRCRVAAWTRGYVPPCSELRGFSADQRTRPRQDASRATDGYVQIIWDAPEWNPGGVRLVVTT